MTRLAARAGRSGQLPMPDEFCARDLFTRLLLQRHPALRSPQIVELFRRAFTCKLVRARVAAVEGEIWMATAVCMRAWQSAPRLIDDGSAHAEFSRRRFSPLRVGSQQWIHCQIRPRRCMYCYFRRRLDTSGRAGPSFKSQPLVERSFRRRGRGLRDAKLRALLRKTPSRLRRRIADDRRHRRRQPAGRRRISRSPLSRPVLPPRPARPEPHRDHRAACERRRAR